MWFLRRRVQVDRLPPERVTVQFEFRDALPVGAPTTVDAPAPTRCRL